MSLASREAQCGFGSANDTPVVDSVKRQERGALHAHLLYWPPCGSLSPLGREPKRLPDMILNQQPAKAPRADGIPAEVPAQLSNTEAVTATNMCLRDIDYAISHCRMRIEELMRLRRTLLAEKCRHDFEPVDLTMPRDNGERYDRCKLRGALA